MELLVSQTSMISLSCLQIPSTLLTLVALSAEVPTASKLSLEPLHGAIMFTKLDLQKACHLVRVRVGDEWKMASNTPLGHYKYLVMPFSISVRIS